MARLARAPHIGLPLLIAAALAVAPAGLPAQPPAPAAPQEAPTQEVGVRRLPDHGGRRRGCSWLRRLRRERDRSRGGQNNNPEGPIAKTVFKH